MTTQHVPLDIEHHQVRPRAHSLAMAVVVFLLGICVGVVASLAIE